MEHKAHHLVATELLVVPPLRPLVLTVHELAELREVVLIGTDGVEGEPLLGAQIIDECGNKLVQHRTPYGWRCVYCSTAMRSRATALPKRSSASTKASRTSSLPRPPLT